MCTEGDTIAECHTSRCNGNSKGDAVRRVVSRRIIRCSNTAAVCTAAITENSCREILRQIFAVLSVCQNYLISKRLVICTSRKLSAGNIGVCHQ